MKIVVSDTGRGIEPEMLGEIFEKHRQARSAELGGLGLGLTIVRHLVELHGGEISAESDGAGKGARFVVRVLGDRRGAGSDNGRAAAALSDAGAPTR